MSSVFGAQLLKEPNTYHSVHVCMCCHSACSESCSTQRTRQCQRHGLQQCNALRLLMQGVTLVCVLSAEC